MTQQIGFIITPYSRYPKKIADDQLSSAVRNAGFTPYMPPKDPSVSNLHEAITS